ncbi:hypothetical protein [Clostridium lundense]|nr:hypothetical protein [Clostridium lundense]
MESNVNKKNISISSTTNGDKKKKDVQLSKAMISNQFCIKMFDYMIF